MWQAPGPDPDFLRICFKPGPRIKGQNGFKSNNLVGVHVMFNIRNFFRGICYNYNSNFDLRNNGEQIPFLSEDGMPKLKTHRGAAKRLKVTGSGKLKRRSGYKSHLLTGKSAKRARRLRTASLVSDADYDRMKKLLPYM